MNQFFSKRRLLSLRDTAEYLGVSLRTLYNRSGKKSRNPLPFPVKRVGKSVRVDINDLERYVESL